MTGLPSYVLITPARNEEAFIELTLKSVTAQTVKPLKWVIVSDGSTDRTDEIVQSYITANPWIELLRLPERKERHFAGKVMAFNSGWDRVKHLPYAVIGNLDADISFDPDYFEFLLSKFAENPSLGVGGTPFTEGRGTYDFRFTSIEHVSGACQMFRRECFDQVGGYIPVKGGGIDHIAVITARMKGWQTRTFTEKVLVHHRQIGTAQHSTLKARFRTGAQDYALGSHLLWEVSRTLYQLTRRPYVSGAFWLLSGYLWSMIRRIKRPVSDELVRFRRQEQTARLKKFFTRSRVSAPAQLKATPYR
jgi:glycosyltransferase involved in cell wall biosynthesis